MSSSGLIYAVIVGAWAAYLVPMWLRRQDELNEARPTERFSTAIRLLSGKAAMERRYAKNAERREAQEAAAPEEPGSGSAGEAAADGDAEGTDPGDAPVEEGVDVRAFADPKTMVGGAPVSRFRHGSPPQAGEASVAADGTADVPPDGVPPEGDPSAGRQAAHRRAAERKAADRKAAERSKRAKVLARRRRTTMVLFLAFSVGAIVAAVGGITFLWAPAAPAALLSAYIAHLRTQERRRFTVTMDRRRAEDAARRLREHRTQREHGPRARRRAQPPAQSSADLSPAGAAHERRVPAGPEAVPDAAGPEPDGGTFPHSDSRVEGTPARRATGEDRRALVEQTDHAEWVDQERGRVREQTEGEGWDPVPVPLPTYVSAPVAPRTNRGLDLDAPDTWSSARSSTAPAPGSSAAPAPGSTADQQPAAPPRPRRERGRTPLFDQMAEKDRRRAANE